MLLVKRIYFVKLPKLLFVRAARILRPVADQSYRVEVQTSSGFEIPDGAVLKNSTAWIALAIVFATFRGWHQFGLSWQWLGAHNIAQLGCLGSGWVISHHHAHQGNEYNYRK